MEASACATAAASAAPEVTASSSSLRSDSKSSERARQRWAILRSALLGAGTADANAHTADGTAGDKDGECDNNGSNSAAAVVKSSASIHRFAGFQLLDRRVLDNNEISALNEEEGIAGDDDEHEYEYAEYTIPIPLASTTSVKVRTRERRKQRTSSGTHSMGNTAISRKKRMRGLLSHRLHGVDNTGQSCVWDSESTLTHCLFASSAADGDTRCGDGSSSAAPSLPVLPLGIHSIMSLAVKTNVSSENSAAKAKRKLRVIELGAGMAGLAGLSLAAFGMSNHITSSVDFGIDIELTLTDGHPDAVKSNRICAALTSQLYANDDSNDNKKISYQRLLWNDGEEGVADCNALTQNGQGRYQLCLASDCVHFQEFHAALLATIGRLLDVGGICLLCQPRRADSLENFMKVVDAVNGAADADDGDGQGQIFEMNLYERYNQRLWDMHVAELNKDDEIYDPTIHYPLMLVLKKVGEYEEVVHTAAAVRHVKERQK